MMKYISYNAVAILLILISAYMIYADKDNWGWVMLAGIFCSVTPTLSGSGKSKDNDTEENID